MAQTRERMLLARPAGPHVLKSQTQRMAHELDSAETGSCRFLGLTRQSFLPSMSSSPNFPIVPISCESLSYALQSGRRCRQKHKVGVCSLSCSILYHNPASQAGRSRERSEHFNALSQRWQRHLLVHLLLENVRLQQGQGQAANALSRNKKNQAGTGVDIVHQSAPQTEGCHSRQSCVP